MIRTFIENTLCGRTESTDPLRTWKKQRALTDGKSGAHVYLVKKANVIGVLKLYPPSADSRRSVRDIAMTVILPDSISPHVFEYGVYNTRPWIIMEKLDGHELYDYKPQGTNRDLEILSSIMVALNKFDETVQQVYNRDHRLQLQPCHRDLHPHNIFICGDVAKLIDFDLAISPFDILRDTTSTHRQQALHSPWLDYILGNYSESTEKYVHWSNLFDSVPAYIQNDADLFQLYSVFSYFSKFNGLLKPLLHKLKTHHTRRGFLRTSGKYLETTIVRSLTF
jgi:serine/threonine protein kinase